MSEYTKYMDSLSYEEQLDEYKKIILFDINNYATNSTPAFVIRGGKISATASITVNSVNPGDTIVMSVTTPTGVPTFSFTVGVSDTPNTIAASFSSSINYWSSSVTGLYGSLLSNVINLTDAFERGSGLSNSIVNFTITGTSSITTTPFTGGVTPKIVKDALLSPNQQDSGISSLLSTTGLVNLIGLQATTATPKSISGNLYTKNKAQAAAINKFANNAGIDTAWIRKQLANGNSPQDVAMAIQAGQGKIKPTIGTGISAKQAQNYTNAINSLNSPG
jgi:hypothetical protein